MATDSGINDASLSFRLPAELKRTIEEAAVRTRQSVSDFAVSTLARAARNVIEQDNFTRLSNADRAVFLSLLDDEEVRPNEPLMAAAVTYMSRHK